MKSNTLEGATTSRVVPLYSPPVEPADGPAPKPAGTRPVDDFPKPSDACFHGLAGDIVRTIQPLTEADPVALLMNVLAAFGSMAGKRCYIAAGGSRHYGNIFWASVGKTAKGRKGTAWQTVKPLFDAADEPWLADCVISGLSTGEGLINQIRDGDGSEDNPGVRDKRLLALEEELARPFKVMHREGNTLSPILRMAWDGGKLRVVTKSNGDTATHPHISIIGHISREELARVLTAEDIFNGTANRFLWLAVRRSQCLAETPEIDGELLKPLTKRLMESLAWADGDRELFRDEPARVHWREVYPSLSDFAEERTGAIGSILARGEAQVTRLSLLFAMLDRSKAFTLPHLKAALAIWRFAEDSARWIFHEGGTGSPHADAILAHLRKEKLPVSRTGISRDVLKGNLAAGKIEAALALLARYHLARMVPIAGDRSEYWQAT